VISIRNKNISTYICIILMSKNYIPQAFYFTLAVAGILGILSLVKGERTLLGYSIKPVSIFSDILSDPSAEVKNIIPKDTLAEEFEPCPKGVVCFRNFTSEKYPLDNLFKSLLKAKEKKDKVRIAWYGDSFSDGDILVSDLRDTLQSIYGGNGVGFVPITSEIAGFRQSVIHSFGGWNTSSILANPGSHQLGINGFSYAPDSGNYVFYKGSNHFKHTYSFNTFRLFYTSVYNQKARIVINRKDNRIMELTASVTPAMITIHSDTIRQVSARLGQGGVTCYGASLEDETGIYIDNFAIKGNSGIGLQAISGKNLAAFDSLLQYDLIVLQFGLNVSNSPTQDFTGYIKGMTRLINKLKAAFPETPILLLSVSDRSKRFQGQFVTMPVIPLLIQAQEKIAYDNKLLFWNLFEAMGGENSMALFANSKPALANKDYTHLNFAGGRKIGLSLARSFIYEVDKYIKRRNSLAVVGN
jgi:lysophospholipase L1-like esterase